MLRLPWYPLLGAQGWDSGGIAPQSLTLGGKPSGADPEHRSEKKLAVQREGRRSTKGVWAL